MSCNQTSLYKTSPTECKHQILTSLTSLYKSKICMGCLRCYDLYGIYGMFSVFEMLKICESGCYRFVRNV
ncbi:MAG: hypothetical protein EOO34_00585 [Cyanobacteriota bacterium]|nr:MAG: hypothetical protein EOO34_00585 [Cyanobacteriota bacterium]